MKQIIVMIAMVILGIAIAGFVNEFKDSAEVISDDARVRILAIAADSQGGH